MRCGIADSYVRDATDARESATRRADNHLLLAQMREAESLEHANPAVQELIGILSGGFDRQEYVDEALNLLTRMVIVTGRDLLTLDLNDFDDYAAARRASGRTVHALPLAYELLHGAGGLAGPPATLRQARNRGQLSVIRGAEVVCADGVDGVEAVVIRHKLTGRLSAVNASAFVSFEESPRTRHN